ncbi:Protein unc-50 [Phytophthora pseudosyringae]|uniref:non-specific serine/threonine protein kinase n=1 Tax=Phytophthora pseudosyringae TaxID=221518 RepID=A0A8T1WAQ8_9STRA|nr:Protein unc-50 [Phytophthora pseudosyringae]
MDGYSRVKLLGEGSFGRVFLMREKKIGGHLVCVKQIHRIHHSKKPEFAPAGRPKSFGVEVDLMEKLRHPNLIRLLNSFVGPSPLRQQHIVMEFCSGGDLRTFLNAYGKQTHCLGEDKIWYWFVQLALGLHHMHQQRVLHRDLKTANVFLSNAGYVVLGDLGIARTLASGDMAATIIGTPLYMAPEVLDGKDYSFSSDVWALGCVLYELCTGKPPFTANNTAQLLNKICHGDYIPIQKGGNLTTSRLPTLVASMLSCRPELRPSVDQLLRDSIARVHIRRYCVDRLRSTTMTDEERRVLVQQVTTLGIDAAGIASVGINGGDHVKGEEPAVPTSLDSYSRLKVLNDRDREGQEKKLMDARERERQDQIRFALEKLQQLRLQFPAACRFESKVKASDCKNAEVVNPPAPPIEVNGGACKQPLHNDQWRDPVRATNDPQGSVGRVQPRGSANLNRSNSVPKDAAFTGVPRAGVPLTAMAKTFADRRPVCRDVRVLRRKEAAKAAERYKRSLDAMHTPRHRKEDKGRATEAVPRVWRRSVGSERVVGWKKDEEDTDAAILQSMACLHAELLPFD